jgi:transcriptional regulator with XRE-family HTH domain
MTQTEVVDELKRSAGRSISQGYLSQIENGSRRHLTGATRQLLAGFFKVHPGYLVDDPDGFHTELVSDVLAPEDLLDIWLTSGAERFGRDADLRGALSTIAQQEDSRRCLILLGAILETPGLAERLLQVLQPHRALARADLSARPRLKKGHAP